MRPKDPQRPSPTTKPNPPTRPSQGAEHRKFHESPHENPRQEHVGSEGVAEDGDDEFSSAGLLG